MLIVADTGPLITLIQLEQLRILEILFPDYVLPEIVFSELNNYRPIQNFTLQIDSLEKHIRKPIQTHPPIYGLNEGELACISLYYEFNADAILIEDRLARQWAESQGIVCLGSIALLIKAKHSGLITQIKPLLLEMRKNKRFISNELLYKTLKNEGEIS
jgi:hypothetical protein